MTKTIEIIKYIILAIICVILQMYLISDSKLFGTFGSIIIMYLLVLSVYSKINVALSITFIVGIVVDSIYTFQIGTNLLIYMVICIGVIFTSNVYKIESKEWVVIYAILLTFVYEIYMACAYTIKTQEILNFSSIILVCLKSSAINVALAYILRFTADKWIRKNTDEYGG